MYRWEKNFPLRILKRGRDYADSGKVTDIESDDGVVSALVEGSEFYKVEVSLRNGDIAYAECTCPYAEDNTYCKHMAALLYTLEDGGEIEHEAKKKKVDLKGLLKSAGHKKLENLLLELADSDDDIKQRILASFGVMDTEEDLKRLKKEIDRIFGSFVGFDHYLEYSDAEDFDIDLSCFVDDRLYEFVQNGGHMTAFRASTYLFDEFSHVEMDYDLENHCTMDSLYSLWVDIIEKCSADEKKELRSWFSDNSSEDDVIKSILDEELCDDDERRRRLAELEEIIEKSKGELQSAYAQSLAGEWEEAIEIRNDLAFRLGESREETEEYMRSYMSFNSVRDYFIDKACEDGDVDEAIRLILLSRDYEKPTGHRAEEFAGLLVDLYGKRGDREDEKAERRWLLLTKDHLDIKDYRKYRSMCSDEEWNEEKYVLFDSRRDVDERCRLIVDEKMYDLLFQTIWAERDKLALVDRYGILFPESHHSEVLGFYSEYLEELALAARNSSRYDALIGYLERIGKYKGGTELAMSLARNWMDLYSSRKMMVQRLERFCSDSDR